MNSCSRSWCAPTLPGFTGTVTAGLLALALAGCADTGVEPGPNQQEQLLFLSTRGGATDGLGRPANELYRMNADGSAVENLTRQAGPIHLSLSPDGKRVAFASLCDIWTMNVDGTGLSQLTHWNGGSGDGCNAWPRWSANGTRIAFATNREGRTIGSTSGLYDVYVMNADGSNPHNVSHAAELGHEVGVAGWSPDGKVVFQSYSGVNGTVIYRVDAVSPDGTGLRTVFAAGPDHSPAWSPDGSKVVFLSRRDGRERLYIMNADGSGVRALTDHAGEDRLPGIDGAGTGTQHDYSPWSPDGTRIAFHRYDTPPIWGTLHVINADGSGERQLTTRHGDFNGWSPRGDRIAVTSGAPGPRDVYVVNADGMGTVNLTNNASDDSDAFWLPRR